jgi:hypothetical protein
MKSRPALSSAGERTRGRRDVPRELAEHTQDTAAVRVGRGVHGHGSSARSAHTSDDGAVMTPAGQIVELKRYPIPAASARSRLLSDRASISPSWTLRSPTPIAST